MRDLSDSLPVPQFDTTAFTAPKPLAEATVAIVTTAAIHTMDDEGFSSFDTGFRLLDRERRDLALGHWSPNFDRSAFAADLDVVYPIDRLEELAADGVIGRVAPATCPSRATSPTTWPPSAWTPGRPPPRHLRHDGVDVVLLTPV